MNILNAQYHREGAAAAWKFPLDTGISAREFGMLGMCILAFQALQSRIACMPYASSVSALLR